MTEAPGHREAEARQRLLAALDEICPGIVGNPYLPHWPTPTQQLFLGLHLRSDSGRVFEALYGGAAGGGKSDCLLMAAAQYVHDPEFSCLVLRRTYAELAKPGAIMDRAISWWVPRGVAWDGTTKTFTFPSGAKVAFGYLAHEQDHLQYQGAEFHATLWDELTQFPRESQYRFIGLSRVRRRHGCTIPLRTLSTSNPGGPGHAWVRQRFVGDPAAGFRAAHPYVPARIADNPHIDRSAYIAGLEGLHPTVRDQLLLGDWSAREPGDYFRREWFGPLLDPVQDRWAPSDCVRVRWWDLAASERPDAARTAGVLMARHRSGVYAIEHAVAFRATPGRRDDLIVQQAQTDGHHVTVGIEIEGGSGGIAQFLSLERRLREHGFRVVGARPQDGTSDNPMLQRNRSSESAKAGRADPVASCLERGYQRRGEGPNTEAPWWGLDATKPVRDHRDGIRLFSGTWTQAYLDEVEGFPDAATCDLVDATSGAWAWLSTRGFGSPPAAAEDLARVRIDHDLHPEDRDMDEDDQGSGTGRWRP